MDKGKVWHGKGVEGEKGERQVGKGRNNDNEKGKDEGKERKGVLREEEEG